ncbi:MJ1477/TM1410 family putative glycoside hydrolase [Paenibacillus harenae]|uniref:Cysteinyl-tRNA synthetase n=1 Tax=Paenibacillus harenae TaxID=306543 RepID=A0ABT9U3W8_PAEHA|nr:MJ1477/TM1410 family putative glycoside hydrolase [Paenibacillus harenae]MDQ0113395.1 cysteinyl-tRNA synthetase [Paenibacillus harenae]
MTMRKWLILLAIVVLSLASVFTYYVITSKSMAERYAELPSERKTWLYQLQNFMPEQAADSGYTVAVIDPTEDGTDKTSYSIEQIEALKAVGVSPIAYLSIGEASYFRTYWQDEWGQFRDGELRIEKEAPEWLGVVANPDWPESVKVRYWEEEWWSNIIRPRLDAVIDAGFDGLYMDIIDAYYYWGDEESYGEGLEARLDSDPVNEQDAAKRMIAFVQRISEYAKGKNESFRIFPQNGEGIIQYDIDGRYVDGIDGIGIEDLWFDETKRQEKEETDYRLAYIRQIADAGKRVLSVDYVDSPDGFSLANKIRVLRYAALCQSEGFYCYAARSNRALDNMNVIAGVQPAGQ